MTRTDIGDFLGLTIETVSRTFTKLKQQGVIELALSNQVKLLDVEELEGWPPASRVQAIEYKTVRNSDDTRHSYRSCARAWPTFTAVVLHAKRDHKCRDR